MSVISVGYSIDLSSVSSISEEDASVWYEMAVEELSHRRKLTDSDLEVLQICLGLRPQDGVTRDLAFPMRWICKNLGQVIRTDADIAGVYNLELPTKLLKARPPFDFPVGDENVFCLYRMEIAGELEDFANSTVIAPNAGLKAQRAAFLTWLTTCASDGTDLVVIES